MSSFVVDTSALIAILADEAEALTFSRAILAADAVSVSAATVHEANCVVARGKIGKRENSVGELLDDFGILSVAFTSEHAEAAKEAYLSFGRGSGHPAQLNMGDCFSYALAKTRNLPLLFKGDDFVHTDLRPALAVNS